VASSAICISYAEMTRQSLVMKAKKRKQRKGKLKPKKKRKQNFLMFDILKISQRILIELLIHQNISFVVVLKKMK
jgi:hypothetical protein